MADERAAGFILLIHPDGFCASIKRGEPMLREMFEQLVLDGYQPVGPRAQEAAKRIREGRGLGL
jgi:hypothetical protein